MPVYQYRCDQCGDFDRFLRLADHSRVVLCECGCDAKQVITAPMVVIPSHMSATGVSAYRSPTTGQIISTQRQRANDLAASGCIEYDPGMRQDADRRVQEAEKKLDADVEASVTKEIEAMPGDKRESLYIELSSGADVGVQRI